METCSWHIAIMNVIYKRYPTHIKNRFQPLVVQCGWKQICSCLMDMSQNTVVFAKIQM
jgi:hypothetical protein